jgi:hypothetical protein
VGRGTRALAIAVTLAAASPLLAGCDGTADEPAGASWSSEHFEYLTRASDTTVCPDVLQPLEEHFALFENYLGFIWPAGRKVSYEKFADVADYKKHADCPSDAGACTAESTVFTPSVLDLHELVHAYLWPTGYPPTVLVEGAAETLSCYSVDYVGGPKPALSWEQLVNADYTTDAYRTGTWLVSYLVDEFGPQKFMALYARLRHDADAATMDAVVRELYGQGLAEIWAAALAEDRPRNVCPWQCSRPALPLDGTAVPTTGVCGLEQLTRPFTLAAESTIGVSATAAYLELRACGQVPVPDLAFSSGASVPTTSLYHLPVGSYFFDYAAVPGTISARFEPAAVLTPTCAAASAIGPSDAPVAFVMVPSSEPNWFLSLPAPTPPNRFATATSVVDPPTSATLCASCDPAGCVSPGAGVPWQSGQVLNIATDPSAPFNTVTIGWF